MVEPGEPIDVHHLFRGGELLSHEALGLDESGQLTQVLTQVPPTGPEPARRARR